MNRVLNSLTSLWSTNVSEETKEAAPASATPSGDKLKQYVDAVFDAAKIALRTRPLALMAVIAADAAIDAVWDRIFPPAKKALASKGIEV